jgi:membrane associated rhomboid family serine protease
MSNNSEMASAPPPRRQPIFNLPGVVLAVVAVLVGIHLLRGVLSDEQNLRLLQNFAFVPGRFTNLVAPNRIAETLAAAQAQGSLNGAIAQYFLGDGKPLWWTVLSYALLHANYLHLGFNCLWLIAFGAAVARRFGALRFVLFCIATALAGALTHYATHLFDLQPVIGASAIVSGTMAAVVRFAFQPGAPLNPAPLNAQPDASPDTDPSEGKTDQIEGKNTVRAAEHAYRQKPLPLRAIVTDRRAMGFLGAWFFANLLVGLAPQLSGMAGASIAWEAHIGGFLVGLFAFRLFDRPLNEAQEPSEPL